ncbi:MAG: hypothetical protein ACI38Q_01380 [Candidatus Bruticola sp.]
MFKWSSAVIYLRLLAAYFVSFIVFGFIFALAPADDLRATAAALIAGTLGGFIVRQKAPGWELFTAGSAFAAVGIVHIVSPSQWLSQAWLPAPVMLCWYLGNKLGAELPTAYKEEPSSESAKLFTLARLRREERRGCLVVLWSSCTSFVLLAPLAPGADWLAFPAAFTLTFAVARKWHIRRQFWPSLGFLIALPLSGLVNIFMNSYFRLNPLQLPDPWLSSGLMIIGACFGLWLASWYHYAMKAINSGTPKAEPSKIKPLVFSR